jgi:hypothetical protein
LQRFAGLDMRQFRPVHLAASLFVIALYVAARCWRLTSSCLWFDEIFSVHAAEQAWNELFSFVALDLIHPPLFYVLLKCWTNIGGDGLLWLRSMPLIFSVAAVVPFILLCRELDVNGWARVLALFLFAINGCLIKYAQEVRMYSLLLFLSLLSMWLFVRFFRRGSGLVPLIIVNLLMIYTHYFGWLIIVAEIAAILIFRRTKWRQAVMMTAITVIGFLPWAIAVRQAAASGSSLGQNIGWMVRPDTREIVKFFLDLIEPFYYQESSVDPASIYRVSVPLLLISGGALAVYFYNWKERSDLEKQATRLLILFACVPAGLAFIASWLLPYSFWGTRHLIVVFAPFSILLSTAIVSIHCQWVRTAAITLVLLFFGLAFVNAARSPAQVYSWCNWEPLGVRAAERGAGKLFVFEDLAAYHLWSRLRDRSVEVTKIGDVPGVSEDPAFFLPRGFDEVKTVRLSDIHEPRIWLAYRAQDVDETKPPLKTFVDEGYKIVDRVVLSARHEQTILLLLEKGS